MKDVQRDITFWNLFSIEKYADESEPSKYIWTLKTPKERFTTSYSRGSKRCRFCLEENFYILKKRAKNNSLNEKIGNSFYLTTQVSCQQPTQSQEFLIPRKDTLYRVEFFFHKTEGITTKCSAKLKCKRGVKNSSRHVSQFRVRLAVYFTQWKNLFISS